MDQRERVTRREMKALGLKSHSDYLRQRFGVRGEDWHWGLQYLLDGINGRMYDVITVSLRDGEAREVYFDLGPSELWHRRAQGEALPEPEEDEEDVPLPEVSDPTSLPGSSALKAVNLALDAERDDPSGYRYSSGTRERGLLDRVDHAFDKDPDPDYPPEWLSDWVEEEVQEYFHASVPALRKCSPSQLLAWAGELEQLVCRPTEVIAQRDPERATRPPVSLPLACLAAAAADLFPGELLLDVGAGTGRLAMWGDYLGGAVLVLEPDPRWIDMAQRRAVAVVGDTMPPECRLESHIRPSVILTSLFASPSDGAEEHTDTNLETRLDWCLQQLQAGGPPGAAGPGKPLFRPRSPEVGGWPAPGPQDGAGPGLAGERVLLDRGAPGDRPGGSTRGLPAALA